MNPSPGNLVDVTSSIQGVQTAAELRRELHAMKANNRAALAEATQAKPILKSQWITSLGTGLATFLLLYVTNPVFVQESTPPPLGPGPSPAGTNAPLGPSMRKIISWSVLAALIVALGPFLYKKFL